jgi:hypothetical protein
MKITLGIVKIVLALAIGILPLFTDCQSQVDYRAGEWEDCAHEMSGRALPKSALPSSGIDRLF